MTAGKDIWETLRKPPKLMKLRQRKVTLMRKIENTKFESYESIEKYVGSRKLLSNRVVTDLLKRSSTQTQKLTKHCSQSVIFGEIEPLLLSLLTGAGPITHTNTTEKI